MSDRNHSMDIAIMGRTYKVTCAEEEREPLLQAVAYLDQKMNEIKGEARVSNVERIAVMAALNIAHELLTTNTPQNASDAFDLREVTGRMAAMQTALDQVLAPQEKLF